MDCYNILAASNADDASSPQYIFSGPVVGNYWAAVCGKTKCETRHRFNSSFSWSLDEEHKLVKKLEERIIAWAWCAVNRSRRNFNQAITDNMSPELGKLARECLA